MNQSKGIDNDRLIAHLVVGCIKIGGSDLDQSAASRTLENSGWEAALEFILKSYDEILAKHTAFSWHEEEDEGVEEGRVHHEKDYAEATLRLATRLRDLGCVDPYTEEALAVIQVGLNVVDSGIFSTNYSVHETSLESLLFLEESTADTDKLARTKRVREMDSVQLKINGNFPTRYRVSRATA